MSLAIIAAGPQATLQGTPRRGFRHMGVPTSGPADALSMALANRLVGNPPDAVALEVTYGGLEAITNCDVSIAITGAPAPYAIDNAACREHSTQHLTRGSRLTLAPPAQGVRSYLAVAGGFVADTEFGSPSTYLPAKLGGYKGRALQAGDELRLAAPCIATAEETPQSLRPHFGSAWALRAIAGPELSEPINAKKLFSAPFVVGRQASRMGARLIGLNMTSVGDGRMKSVPVFPGTVQCPPDGAPFLLLADAQTTGGYPRLAQIIRADQHLLGQLRPGDHVQLLHRDVRAARSDLAKKSALFAEWLGGFAL